MIFSNAYKLQKYNYTLKLIKKINKEFRIQNKEPPRQCIHCHLRNHNTVYRQHIHC